MLERLAGQSHYCFLDGFSGYFQIHIAPEDQEKTTFTCLFGTFAYRRMPFGLCNAPGTFQRCMVSIFSDFLENCMEVFMDDFTVFGSSFDACLDSLTKVLERCISSHLVLNFEKCHFMVQKGVVLGHIISQKGISVDKAKIDVITSLPYPACVREIRSFLGHTGFYRRFIKDFSKTTLPLTKLLQKDVEFCFDEACKKAFDVLKGCSPVIQPPDWTLPFELMCDASNHALGAVLAQSVELIGSTDFVEKGTENVVFRTCDQERDRVVFQIGTSDAVRALTASQLVSNDVAAIDVNMGCPKSFSISGGMGAALLSKPDLIHDILTTLKRNLSTPVTCKIRLLKSPHDTVELARRIEKTGVSALAVHGRKVQDRPRDPAKWNEIADVVSALSIPVIANGDVFEYDDIQRIKSATGASSVMVARGALWNASIFLPEGKLPYEDVKREYVRKCILWDNDLKSTKHTLKEMIMYYSCLELPEGKAVIKSDSLADLADLYGQEEYYQFVSKTRFLVNGYR